MYARTQGILRLPLLHHVGPGQTGHNATLGLPMPHTAQQPRRQCGSARSAPGLRHDLNVLTRKRPMSCQRGLLRADTWRSLDGLGTHAEVGPRVDNQ